MRSTLSTADVSTVRLLDGLVGFWVMLWLVLGGWTGYTIWDLSVLGDTVTRSGEAIGTAGEALDSLGGVPVIGDDTAQVGEEVAAAGADIAERGQAVQSQLRQLALLLGLAIAVMPTTPVIGLYAPLRAARRREVAALRRSLARHRDDSRLERHLAERAVRNLPFDEVEALVGDPWRALHEGDTRVLAAAELQRLGLGPERG